MPASTVFTISLGLVDGSLESGSYVETEIVDVGWFLNMFVGRWIGVKEYVTFTVNATKLWRRLADSVIRMQAPSRWQKHRKH